MSRKSSPSEVQLAPLNVAIIDDDAEVLEELELILKVLDFQGACFHYYSNPTEAIDEYATHKVSGFDIVLSDNDLGQFGSARDHLEKFSALFDPEYLVFSAQDINGMSNEDKRFISSLEYSLISKEELLNKNQAKALFQEILTTFMENITQKFREYRGKLDKETKLISARNSILNRLSNLVYSTVIELSKSKRKENQYAISDIIKKLEQLKKSNNQYVCLLPHTTSYLHSKFNSSETNKNLELFDYLRIPKSLNNEIDNVISFHGFSKKTENFAKKLKNVTHSFDNKSFMEENEDTLQDPMFPNLFWWFALKNLLYLIEEGQLEKSVKYINRIEEISQSIKADFSIDFLNLKILVLNASGERGLIAEEVSKMISSNNNKKQDLLCQLLIPE